MLRHTSCPSKRYRLAGHPEQSYRPAPGHSTASSLPAATMVEPAMSLSSSAAPAAMEKRTGNTTRESRRGIGFGTVCYVEGILNRVRNRYSRSDRRALKQFPSPSHDFPGPRKSHGIDTITIDNRNCETLCLSVYNGPGGQTSLYRDFKKEPFRALFSDTGDQD